MLRAIVLAFSLRMKLGIRKLMALAAIASLCGACSAILPFEQCSVDEDCTRFGDGLVCGGDNVCLTQEQAVDECSNTRCAADDPNSVCGASGQCVSVLSPECTSIHLPSNRENMIVLGSIQPTSGDAASAGIPQENAVVLALADFNESGLIGDARYGLVGCDSAGDLERGVAAATHLSEVVGTPAIVGPAFSGIFIEAATTVTIPAGVMTISGSATSETISTIPDDDLAWRTIASDSFQSVAIADRVRDLRAELGGDIKVAAFGKDDAYGKGLLFAVGTALESELGEDNYFGVLHPDPANDANADIPTAVATALESNFYDADVVLLLGTAEIVDVLASYETILDDEGLAETPRYILSDGGKIDETLELVAADSTLQSRVEGTIPSLENGAIYTGFKQRFAAEFGVDPGSFGSNAYDAAYLLGYAGLTMLATETELSGANFAAFMQRFISGQTVTAGPTDIGGALTALQAGADIDFEGASGLLAFDLATGEAPSNVDRYVIDVRAADDLRFDDNGRYEVDASGAGEWIGIVEP